MMKKILILIIVAIACMGDFSLKAQNGDIDSLIQVLDHSIANRNFYRDQKEEKIASLHQEYAKAKDTTAKFHALGHLFDEYMTYDIDSALALTESRKILALKSGDEELICHAKLSTADLMSFTGMYAEALGIMQNLNGNNVPQYLRPYLYHIFRTTYGHMADYSLRNEDKDKYMRLTDIYRDSMITCQVPGSLYDIIIRSDKLNSHNDAKNGAALLERYIRTHKMTEHELAIAAYTLSESYRLLGDRFKEKRQLIISAIGDMKSGVREYVSLRKLAIILYQEGDVQHAYDYLTICMDDATECSARLRMMEINNIFPVVNNVYLDTINKQQKRLRWGLALVCLLSFLLIVAIYFINKEKSKVSAARKNEEEMNAQLRHLNSRLKQSNEMLIEANHSIAENSYLKEEYIARYMDQCSVYIEKLDKYRKSLNKILASGKIDELKKYTKTLSQLDDELRSFYDNFDNTFLKLFPTFVEDFNSLLQEDERIYPKVSGKLNTELRIFALIRLGINDSIKIAQFLRYSVTTIYNYRTRVRNKAAGDRDSLENDIMKIGRNT